MRFALALLLSLLSSMGLAHAQRVALVVGNSDYTTLPKLKNPVQDSEAIAQQLANLGFTVYLSNNQSATELHKSMTRFLDVSQTAEVALLYYAGHGAALGNQSFLFSPEFSANDQRSLASAISLNSMLDHMGGSTTLRIVFVDACLTQIVILSDTQTIEMEPLAPLSLPGNTVASFSTTLGYAAHDGIGRHSLYSGALLDSISRPNVEISLMLRAVNKDVISASQGQQHPHLISNYLGAFYFNLDRNQPTPALRQENYALATHSGFSNKTSLAVVQSGISAPVEISKSRQNQVKLVKILCSKLTGDLPKLCKSAQ